MFTEVEIKDLMFKYENYVSPFNLDRHGEAKVCYSATLQRICELSKALDFNELGDSINWGEVNSAFPHVLTLMLFDHKADKDNLDTHHRVLVELHIKNSYEPKRLVLDVLASQWEKLPLAEEYVKVVEQLKDNGNKILTTDFYFQKRGK